MFQNGQKPVSRAICYTRVSTTETRQDCDNQIHELKRFCEAQGWAYDVVSEYDSGYSGKQEKLQDIIEQIKRGCYQVIVVFSLDRFSRAHPSRVNRLLDAIVYEYGCRFVSRQENLDSDNEMVWQVIKPLFSWFSHVYSKNLSEKIRLGIRTKKEKGVYKGGRPAKQIDAERLRTLRLSKNGYGWRRLTQAYNEGLPDKQQVSVSLLRRVCQKLTFKSEHESVVN